MKKLIGFVVVVLSLVTLRAEDTKAPFYVYTEAGSRLNHGIPSGFMGDWGSLHMNQRWNQKPGKGQYCIQIKYSGERPQNAGWAGIYTTRVSNNWGNLKDKGYDLTGYTKLKFMARGEKGKEYIDKFFFGGITGENSFDTDGQQTDGIELTKEWKEYEIDLKGLDLSGIIAPFAFVINADSNPEGATFYLDEVQFVADDSKQAAKP